MITTPRHHPPEIKTPAARQGEAGAKLEGNQKETESYCNFPGRAMVAYSVGPDLIVQVLAFTVGVLNG